MLVKDKFKDFDTFEKAFHEYWTRDMKKGSIFHTLYASAQFDEIAYYMWEDNEELPPEMR